MAQIFPRRSNELPRRLLVVGPIVALAAASGMAYFFSPEFTDVGYRPRQPVAFSHKLHAGELEIDCRYCHVAVEVSPLASVPPTRTCMNCHALVGRDEESLAPVRESLETGEPLRWVRVHRLPDYAYFDHSAHLRAGVGCSSCHGNVAEMEETTQTEPLSMSWCLDCHRDFHPHLRPRERLTDPRWQPPQNQLTLARTRAAELRLDPPTDCTACHR